MHSCIHLLTKEQPTNEEIEKIMEPYCAMNQLEYDEQCIGWDWYTIGGRYRDSLVEKSGLKCNGAYLKDLSDTSDLACHCFIDLNGKAYSRDAWSFNHWIENTDFESRYKQALEEAKDGYITVIDIHE